MSARKRFALIALGHFVVSIGVLAIAGTLSLNRLDGGEKSSLAWALTWASNLLTFPFYWPLATEFGIPLLRGFLPFAATSIMWGFGLSSLIGRKAGAVARKGP